MTLTVAGIAVAYQRSFWKVIERRW